MTFAILQKELAPLSPDQLKKAFRVLPAFTELDVQTAASDAFGILRRGLDLEEASLLQNALMREGVDTEVVEESELPVIPPAKLVRQVEFLPAHLSMYDPMGRIFNLSWQEIMMIAAGNVRLPEFRKGKPPEFAGAPAHEVPGALPAKEAAQFHLMLEIILSGGVSRYSIIADDFVFNHLGSRLTNQLTQNFMLLVQDLAQFAPHAGLNRGAYLICENAPSLMGYSSKAAFFEELVWMLWRSASAASGT